MNYLTNIMNIVYVTDVRKVTFLSKFTHTNLLAPALCEIAKPFYIFRQTYNIIKDRADYFNA